MRQKTKRTVKRLLSILLTLTLLIQMLPMEPAAHAAEPSDGEPSIQMSGDRAVVEVVGEMKSLREETVKHFRLSDGSFLAVDYGMPVHYPDEEDGWQNIDNSLSLVTRADGTAAYHTANAAAASAFAASLTAGQLLTAEYGGYTVGMGLLDTAQAHQMAAAAAQDPALQDNAAARAGLTGEISITPDADGGSVGLAYDRTATARVLSADTVEPLSLTGQEDTGEHRGGFTTGDIMPRSLSSTLLYEDVYDGVDLRYTAYSYNIKEEIILRKQLPSYRFDFLLSLDGLTAALQEDGSVSLTDSAGTAVYRIPAPYMEDAAGEISYDVSYTLTPVRSGIILTVTAENDWVDSPQRVFPVTIDPTFLVVAGAAEDAGMYAAYVSERHPTNISESYDRLNVGVRTEGKQYQTYLYINHLPEIPAGANVVGAELGAQLASRSMVECTEFYVGLYEVTDNLKTQYGSYYAGFTAMTWDNRPAFDGANMIDYVAMHNAETVNPDKADAPLSNYTYWDMTELAKKWYLADLDEEDEDNRTIALAATDRDETHTDTYKGYGTFKGYSTDRPPVMLVYYRNTVGMEPYYTYSSFPAGEAGTGYVSDATGCLKVVKEIFRHDSAVNPFTLNLVYNEDYFCNNNSTPREVLEELGLSMRLGTGWTLDIVRKIEKVEVPLDPSVENGAAITYLCYHDGDGTLHYFTQDSSKDTDGISYYYDEDGLGLKIRVTNEASGSYEMSDDQGNKWIFTGGFMTCMEDADGNRIEVAYSEGRLQKITQKNAGAREVVLATFGYTNSDARVLSQITDASGTVHTLIYGADETLENPHRILTGIKRGNTRIARYDYFLNWLICMDDMVSGYRMRYWYAHGRVSEYCERAWDPTAAEEVYSNGIHGTITYPDFSQTIYRDCGADRTINTADDIYTYYLFDYAGRTVSACTTDAAGNVVGGTNAVYTGTGDTNKKNNRTSQTGSVGVMAMQLMRNSGFEVDPATNPTSSRLWTMTAGGSISGSCVRTGLLALKGTVNGSTFTATRPTEPLTAGRTYTLSGYIRTTGMTAFTGDGVYLKVSDASGRQWSSEGITYVTSDLVEDGWTRIHVTFTAAASAAHTVSICASGTGTFYADDLQLELGGTPSNRNLLENGSFDAEGYGWGMTEAAVYSPFGEGWRLRIKGDPKTTDLARAYQDVTVNLPGTQTYILSGWAWGNSVPDNIHSNEDPASDMVKQFGLRAILTYSDGSTENHYAPFDPDVSEYQFTSLTIVPKKPELTVSAIRVVCAYERNANETRFDNISLVREAARTMRYDDDGNLIAATTSGLKEDTNTYQNGNLIQTVTGGYGTYTYTYDTTYSHRLKEVSNGVVKQTLSHDASGNVTRTVLRGVDGGKQMSTTATYTDDGNRPASVTDAAGQSLHYAYGTSISVMTGQPTAITDAAGTVTLAAYDNQGRTTQKSIADTVSLAYNYSKGRLDSVIRTDSTGKSQTIGFVHDVFGNTTAVKIGTMPLASYEYASGNGLLKKQTYGSGDYITYTYDNLQRLTRTSYSGGRTLTYAYTGDGQLYSITDNNGTGAAADDVVYDYTYDTLGRAVRCRVKESSGTALEIHWQYDDCGRILAQEWQMGDASYRETYTYSPKDGSLADIRYGTIPDAEMTMGYDSLQRLISVGTGLYTRAYTYRDMESSADQTTTQVQTLAYSGDVSKAYQYTYNALGYIATYQSTDEAKVTYTYDNQGQLTQAVTEGGPTYTYTYDTAGNILTASDGAATGTYTYGNTSWRDLLTAYNSQNIAYEGQTYDAATGSVSGTPASGNPVSYYNGTRWALDWNEGRNLISAAGTVENSDTEEQEVEATYTYDADGLRRGKTVTVETYELVTHTHEYTVVTRVEPTCTEDGHILYECACGDSYQETLDATGHLGGAVSVVEPTCTAKGYTLYECHCGTTYKDDYKDALGHDYRSYGGLTFPKCTRCGQTIGGGGITNPPQPTSSAEIMSDPEEPRENGDLLEAEDSLEEYVAEEGRLEEDIDESQLQESATQSSDESSDAGESESMTAESSLEDLIAGESRETEDEETQSLTPVEETTAEEAAVEEIPLESSAEEVPLEGSEEEVPSKSSVEEAAEESSTAMAGEESAEAAAGEGNEAQPAVVTGRTLVSTKTESHDYIYAGGKLLRDTITITADGTATTQTLDFRYDENGYPYSMIRTSGGTTTIYYYITNLQGDVMYLVDESGSTVASYIYDPYGNILTATGELAEVNPLRYRGYAYDEETGLYYVSSRYYDPEIGRWINADGYVSTGQGVLGTNMFAYCGNNPVNRVDYTGQFWSEIWEFAKTAVAEIGKAMGVMSPAYAGCGGAAAADGPLPFGDVVAIAGAAMLTVGAIGYGIYQAAQAPAIPIPKVEEKAEVIPAPLPSPTVIYRYGGTNPGNLTPKAKDKYSGLSFSTVPRPGAAMTTIEALNATGVVYAVQDGATHVSVRPVGATMEDWINAGSGSIWTQAVKSVVIKWDGGY